MIAGRTFRNPKITNAARGCGQIALDKEAEPSGLWMF